MRGMGTSQPSYNKSLKVRWRDANVAIGLYAALSDTRQR
jgi:hypothetical protein